MEEMEYNFDDIKKLILKSILEELTEEEQKKLQDWYSVNEFRRSYYNRIISGQNIKGKIEFFDTVNIEQALEKNLNSLQKNQRKRVLLRILPYVAAIILCIGLLFVLKKEHVEELPLQVALNPGVKQAELIFPNGKTVLLEQGVDVELDDNDVNINVVDNSIILLKKDSLSKSDEVLKLRVPHGGEYSLELTDGTKVWLNSMSEIHYPKTFEGEIREVFLIGEAYFEVAKDENRKFIVKAGELNIEVLGTSFNISAYPDESFIYTTLCTGRVIVNHINKVGRGNSMSPGQQLVFNKENKEVEIRIVDSESFISWTKGFFQFENNSIEEVFHILGRWYSIDVEYMNPNVKNELFTGKLPRFEELNVILNLIEKVSDLKIEIKGNKVIVK